MTCPSLDQLIGYLDGELESTEASVCENHLQICQTCMQRHQALRQIVQAVAPAVGEFQDETLVQEILNRLPDAQRSLAKGPKNLGQRWRWRRPWLLPAVAAVVGVAAAFLFVVGLPHFYDHRAAREGGHSRNGFMARGSTQQDQAQWINVWAFRRVAQSKNYAEIQETIRPNDHLTFAYLNAKGQYPYLMIFAVNSSGRIYWYYPAYERAGSDPACVSIQSGKHELKEEVLQPLEKGPLYLFALFSRQPLQVSYVESVINFLSKQKGTASWSSIQQLPVAGTALLSKSLEVTEQ